MKTKMHYWKRRQVLRRGVRTECHAVAEKDFRFIGSKTLDLSPAGALIASTAKVEVGESVVISLAIPGGTSWIDAESEVTRIVRGRRLGDASGIGIRFTQIGAVDKAILEGSLQGYPPPVPQRPLSVAYVTPTRDDSDGPDYAGYVREIAIASAAIVIPVSWLM